MREYFINNGFESWAALYVGAAIAVVLVVISGILIIQSIYLTVKGRGATDERYYRKLHEKNVMRNKRR